MPLLHPAATSQDSERRGRIAAVVGLVLLEVIRARDLPTEILDSEDPAQTLPRRLGLSDVVELQIKRYREGARRRQAIPEGEARDLFHLVLRRPDSEEVFFQAGELLAGKDRGLLWLRGLLPEKVRYALAKQALLRRIRALFGRPIGGLAHGSFTLEARAHLLMQMDPGGDACALLTGLSEALLARYLLRPVRVSHASCQSRKNDLCRWTVKGPPG